MAIDVKDDARKKALLLHNAGEKVQDVFEIVNHDKSTFPETKKALTEHFQPKRNLSYEVFNFRTANQQEDETVDQFASRLRELSAHCEFHDVERELKSQIELGTTNKKVRRYAFRSPDLTLEELLLYVRTLEHTELQAKDIEHAPSPRHAAEVQKVMPHDKPFSKQSQKRKERLQKINATIVVTVTHMLQSPALPKESSATNVKRLDILCKSVVLKLLVRSKKSHHPKQALELLILPRLLSASRLAVQSTAKYVLTRDIFLLAIPTRF